MKSMKNKTNDRFTRIKGVVFLGILTVLGMCYCFLKSEIFPFGTNSNLFSDLATQYVNFLVFFRESTWAEKVFSLTKGFGGQTFGLLSYYTFSPFNFIVYLFSAENIETALFVIFLARAVFMAENMYYYLSRHYKNSLFNVAVALMYTFYPFFTRYYFNILWTDCFALLPLVILGTERIMDGKSGKLFVFAYVYSLVSNYYIAYMSSLFVLLWFVYRFIVNYGFDILLALKKAVRMAYYTGISIMLSAPVLLPSYILLTQGKFGDDTISSWTVVKPYDIRTLPVSFFEGGMTFEYSPHFVGSIVCIFLLVSFVWNRNIRVREKIATSVFFSIMTISFMFRILGYIWHGFSAPQGFHNRQTFVYAFFMLIICREALEKLDFKTAIKTLLCIIPLYGVFVAYINRMPTLSVSKESYIITAVSVIFTVICFMLLKKYEHQSKKLLALYMCGIAIYMGGYFMSGQYNGDKPYTMAPSAGQFKENYLEIKQITDSLDEGFYRIEDPTRWSQNQAMANGYNSVSHYSSVFETAQKEMFIHYGFEDTYYSTTYSRSLPLNDFVFGIKYVITSDTSLVTDHYSLVRDGYKKVYKNPFYIPVVYTGKTNEVEVSDYWVNTVNNMAVMMTGIDIYKADGNADYNKLKTIAEKIREKECEVTKNNGMFLSFKTESTEDDYLLSSLMYDENWHIKVNGKNVHQEPYMKYFLSIPLESGIANRIEMVYVPSGMIPGLIIMVTAFVTILIHYIIKRKIRRTDNVY